MAARQALQCAIGLVVWQDLGRGRLGLSAVAEERGAHLDATTRSTAPGVIWVRNSVSIVSRLRRLRSRELIRRAAIVMETLVLERQLRPLFPAMLLCHRACGLAVAFGQGSEKQRKLFI